MMHFVIKDLQRGIYYTTEYVGTKLIEEIAGSKLRMKDVMQVRLVGLETEREKYLTFLKERIEEEFDVAVKLMNGEVKVPSRMIWRSRYVSAPSTARFLLKKLGKIENSAILGITRYKLSLPPPIIFRHLHHFTHILGISYINYGVALVTTLNDNIPSKALADTSLHELAHLMGKHGYPLYGNGRFRRPIKVKIRKPIKGGRLRSPIKKLRIRKPIK